MKNNPLKSLKVLIDNEKNGIALMIAKEAEALNEKIDQKLEEITPPNGELERISKSIEETGEELRKEIGESIEEIYQSIDKAQTKLEESFEFSDKQYNDLSKSLDNLRESINQSFIDSSKKNSTIEEALASIPKSVETRIKDIRSYISLEIKKIDDLKISDEFKKLWKLIKEIEKYAKEIGGQTGGSGYPDVAVNNGKAVFNSAYWNFKNGSGTTARVSQNAQTGQLDVSFDAPGSPGTAVYEEIPSGSGTSFSLAHNPITGTVRIYRGGARQQNGIDYIISGANITLMISLASGEVLLADYNY